MYVNIYAIDNKLSTDKILSLSHVSLQLNTVLLISPNDKSIKITLDNILNKIKQNIQNGTTNIEKVKLIESYKSNFISKVLNMEKLEQNITFGFMQKKIEKLDKYQVRLTYSKKINELKKSSSIVTKVMAILAEEKALKMLQIKYPNKTINKKWIRKMISVKTYKSALTDEYYANIFYTYAYRNISTEEIKKYIDFLEEQHIQKFYSIISNSIEITILKDKNDLLKQFKDKELLFIDHNKTQEPI